MRRYTLGLAGREFVIDVQELTADQFEVIVGGQRYDVVLAGDEDLPDASITPAYLPAQNTGSAVHAPAPAVVARAPTQTASATPRAVAPARAGADGAGTLTAPMPGVILEVHVKVGDVIRRGQAVAVLEAMKMHNSIGAPRNGTIIEVCVEPGQAVGHGDALVRFAQE